VSELQLMLHKCFEKFLSMVTSHNAWRLFFTCYSPFITGPPTHSVGGQTCNGRGRLSSSVVCNAAGRRSGRALGRSGGQQCTAGQYGYVPFDYSINNRLTSGVCWVLRTRSLVHVSSELQRNISTVLLTKWWRELARRVSDIQTPLLSRRLRWRSSKTAGILATPYLQSANNATVAITSVCRNNYNYSNQCCNKILIKSLFWQSTGTYYIPCVYDN